MDLLTEKQLLEENKQTYLVNLWIITFILWPGRIFQLFKMTSDYRKGVVRY